MALYTIATDLDPNSHGAGSLNATQFKVFINNFRVGLLGDAAGSDEQCSPYRPDHCAPNVIQGSLKVFIQGRGVHRHGDHRVCGATTTIGFPKSLEESNTKVFAG